MANLGFVGLGVMGGEMVNRLLGKGHSVRGYNRTRSKAEWLVKKGMKWADSPRAVVAAAEVTFSMVTNSAALGAVMNGPDGMLAGVTPGKIFVDMSTLSPAFSRELAAKVREKGGDLVDSPVSGSVITLQEGKLSVMVGWRKETFEKVTPLLHDIEPKVTHGGDNGLAQMNELYTRALMAGLAHLYIGEEAVAVGICEALRKDDYITSTHRGHGHCVAKGASPDRMFAELLGKEAGYCRGKGGSMHIADPATGNLGANAIVGGSAGIATGAALSAKRLGTGQVAVCFFGEGALGQGVLYEVMNLAALWKLPVIYVCENNLYTEYTHYSETTAGDILARGTAFGVQAESVDGQDVRAVYAKAQKLVERARNGGGPGFLVCETYRYTGHHVGDINREYYRSKQEELEWKTKRDPIKNFSQWLVEQKFSDEGKLKQIQEEVRAEMKAAVEFAIAAPYPAVDQVDQDVYA